MSDVKFPRMRAELIEYLEALADIDYQRRIWVLGGKENSIQHDELDYAIHFFYDDTQLAKKSSATIGAILQNNEEVLLIEKLIKAFEAVFQKYGTELSDGEYIELPEWNFVLIAAKEALSFIR